MTTERDSKLTVRMSRTELAMLERIAEAEGMTVSDVVRQYARRTHAALFPDAPKKKGGK